MAVCPPWCTSNGANVNRQPLALEHRQTERRKGEGTTELMHELVSVRMGMRVRKWYGGKATASVESQRLAAAVVQPQSIQQRSPLASPSPASPSDFSIDPFNTPPPPSQEPSARERTTEIEDESKQQQHPSFSLHTPSSPTPLSSLPSRLSRHEMAAVKVAVTGAAGQIGYALVPLIARGILLGPSTHVELRLLDIEPALQALAGVEAELDDCAFPLLDKVIVTADPRVAFYEVTIAIMCGALPRKAGMERKDLLEINARIFKEHGEAIAAVAASDCRVVVVGNPANTNALILLKSAQGKLNPRHVTAMTRLDHNRALSMLARKAGVPASQVRNVIIWGNHSSTQVPDVDSAMIGTTPARDAIRDTSFDDDFVKGVRGRGTEIIHLRGLSSAMSAAKAAVDHVHDWMLGTPDGVYVSMGVYSNGNPYNVPDDLIFSFPCTCRAGEWFIVAGKLKGDPPQQRLAATIAELEEEKKQIGL